jgi:hypothetical protein
VRPSFFKSPAELRAWYRKKAVFWVESAVQEETRERRLRALMTTSRAGVRLDALSGQAASRARRASPSGKP